MKERYDVENITEQLGMTHGQLTELLMNYHVGERRAVTARRLRRKGYGDAVYIRAIVHDLREAGVPICSSNKGYFFAETLCELNAMILSLSGRANSIMDAHKGLLLTYVNLMTEND